MNNSFVSKLLQAGVVAAIGFLAAGPVLAQTPDGETPALEGVCDELKGGTPGLYGLCIAFCEAQDLDEVIQEAMAGGVPGEKVLERYRAKSKAGDPDMPCIISASACPCFNIDVCLAHEPAARCGLPLVVVSDAFLGRSCAAEDLCANSVSPLSAFDRCQSSDPLFAVVASARTTVIGTGFCTVEHLIGTASQGKNAARLDFATAQLCVDELNAFDGNGPLDGTVLQCGLGTLP